MSKLSDSTQLFDLQDWRIMTDNRKGPESTADVASLSLKPLRILTLNCWGLKFVSAHRRQRIRAIAEFVCRHHDDIELTSASTSLDSGAYQAEDSARLPQSRRSAPDQSIGKGSRFDVICLQEVWCSEDWEYIQAFAKSSGSGLTHARYFWSGALGSGCCILSKYPIMSALSRPYSLCGSPLHFIAGDWYVAKAIGQATLDLGPTLGYLTVLNTHMAAFGGPEWSEHWQSSHRLTQAWELARLANEAIDRGHHVVVCGDLNSRPTSLVMNLLLSQGRLSDSWASTHPPASANLASPSTPISAQDAIIHNGITCDNSINSFSAAKNFDEVVTRAQGKRLDYILFRSPMKGKGQGDADAQLRCTSCKVTATELVPLTNYSLSDHFGVDSTFAFAVQETTNDGEEKLIPPRSSPVQHMQLTLTALSQYAAHADKVSQSQLGIFAVCIAMIPGISIAASFQPLQWLNWIFAILGIANGALGATMLYTGFIGGRWEKSALKNAINDITLELQRYQRDDGR